MPLRSAASAHPWSNTNSPMLWPLRYSGQAAMSDLPRWIARWHGPHPLARTALLEFSIANSQSQSTKGLSSSASSAFQSSRAMRSMPSTTATSIVAASAPASRAVVFLLSCRAIKSYLGELSRAGRRRKGLAAGAPTTMRRFAILYEQAS